MLSHTSTEWAPWHVIPADHKWFARICVGAVLGHALMELDPRYPDGHTRNNGVEELEAREALLAEAPPGQRPTSPSASRAGGGNATPDRGLPGRRSRHLAAPHRGGTGRSW